MTHISSGIPVLQGGEHVKDAPHLRPTVAHEADLGWVAFMRVRAMEYAANADPFTLRGRLVIEAAFVAGFELAKRTEELPK